MSRCLQAHSGIPVLQRQVVEKVKKGVKISLGRIAVQGEKNRKNTRASPDCPGKTESSRSFLPGINNFPGNHLPAVYVYNKEREFFYK